MGRLTPEEWEWLSEAVSSHGASLLGQNDELEKIRISIQDDEVEANRRIRNVRQRLRTLQRLHARVDDLLTAADADEERRHFNRACRLMGRHPP